MQVKRQQSFFRHLRKRSESMGPNKTTLLMIFIDLNDEVPADLKDDS
jgi:hypothetical protein